MKIKTNIGKIEYETLDNGVTLYFIKTNKKDFFAMYLSEFGGYDKKVFVDNKLKTYEEGLAHFIEHKLFAEKDNIAVEEKFNNLGVDINAQTSFNTTTYYIYGNKNFKKAYDLLLDFTNNPYFTKKNVDQERDIIKDELRLYQEELDYKLFNSKNKLLFNNKNYYTEILGTEESLDKIDEKKLKEAYDVFYNSNNISVIVSGNTSFNYLKKKILEKIPKDEKISIKRKDFDEEKGVSKTKATLKFREVERNKKLILIKLLNKENKNYKNLVFSVLINILFGRYSEFKQKELEEELVETHSISSSLIGDFIIFQLIYLGEKEKEFEELFIKTMKKELDKETFDLIVNDIKNDYISKSEKASFLSSYIYSILDKKEGFKYIDIDDLLFEDVKALQKEFINSPLVKVDIKKDI